MKVFKKEEHSLLFRPLELEGEPHLALGVCLYFNLLDPEQLQTEQELWRDLSDQMGEDFMFDQALPKPRGEFLVTGACHNPDGQRTRSHLSVRVGRVSKRLYVFGDREWKNLVVTEPKPFTAMPVAWSNAFGGPGFERNPLGKGASAVVGDDGRVRRPLPNLEYPDQLIGAESDRPEPAAFGPLDVMWPQRAAMRGTYDQAWLDERWPYGYPRDMDPEFFNCAPRDQRIDGYFRGDESIEIVNMHPDHPHVVSRLPGRRVRLFMTRKADFELFPVDRQFEEVFAEIPLRIDTVWLLPGVLRGVALYRGVARVADEEYEDVSRVLIRTEWAAEEPRPVEEYYEMMKRAHRLHLEEAQPPNIPPEAQRQLAQALKLTRQVPKYLESAKQKASGQAPAFNLTHAEARTMHANLSQKGLDGLAGFKDQARSMKQTFLQQFGFVPFDPEQGLDQVERKLKKSVKAFEKAAEADDKAAAQLRELAARNPLVQEALDKQEARRAPAADDRPLTWADRAHQTAVAARKNMVLDRDAAKPFHDLGFQDYYLSHDQWLGVVHEAKTYPPQAWGLEPSTNPVHVPAGLLFPWFDGPKAVRLVVRPCDPKQPSTDPSGDVVIEGSEAVAPMWPAALNPDSAPVLVMPDPLAGMYAEQELGDCVTVLALGSPEAELDDAASGALDQATAAAVFLTGQAAQDKGLWDRWLARKENAVPVVPPEGADVFDARAKGHDLRTLVMAALPVDFAQANSLDLPGAQPKTEPGQPADPAPEIPIDPLNIAEDLKAFGQKRMELGRGQMAQNQQELRQSLEAVKTTLAREAPGLGRSPQELTAGLDRIVDPPAVKPTGMFEKLHARLTDPAPAHRSRRTASDVLKETDWLKKQGALTPEKEASLTEYARSLRAGADRTEAVQRRYLGMLKKNEAGVQAFSKMGQDMAAAAEAGPEAAARAPRPDLSQALPPDKQKEMKKMGVKPEFLKDWSRSDVEALLAERDRIEELSFSEIDLSKLDFSGKTLARIIFDRCDFTGADFSDARLEFTAFTECDLSQAKLAGGRWEKCSLSQCDLKKADFTKTELYQVLLGDGDASAADFTGADLQLCILDNLDLTEAGFSRASAKLTMFDQCRASAAGFSRSSFQRCSFDEVSVDGADFSEADLTSSTFDQSQGRGVRFQGSNLENFRLNEKVIFPEADFSGANLDQAYFRYADLNQSVFTGASMNRAIVERSDLRHTDLGGVPMFEARLEKTDLGGANITGSNLMRASLKKSRLNETDLSRSNLFGVQVFKTKVGKIKTVGAHKKRTRL